MDDKQYEKMVEGFNLIHKDLEKNGEKLATIKNIMLFFLILSILGFVVGFCSAIGF